MLTNKKVLIFGGTGLIGRSLVRGCLANGAEVSVGARNPELADFDDLPDASRARLSATGVDVNDPASVENMLRLTDPDAAPFDAVVNCTFPRSDTYGARFEDVAYEDFLTNVNLHLGSAFLVCQKAATYFSTHGRGNIINVSSIYGVIAPRFDIYEGTAMTKEVEYIVCKSAIIHLTKYLAKYLQGKNIRVNCVSPGGVENEEPSQFIERYNAHCMNKGMLAGEDVAGTVLFLLSDMSQYVNGQNIVVDDGFSL